VEVPLPFDFSSSEMYWTLNFPWVRADTPQASPNSKGEFQ